MTTLKPIPDSAMARRLRVSVVWLRAEAAAGRLPCVRAGDRFLFDPDLVERLLLARARQPIPECDRRQQ
jgi:hypothetical protein